MLNFKSNRLKRHCNRCISKCAVGSFVRCADS
jgi:hypothetical protein